MSPEIEAFRHVDRSDRRDRQTLPENPPGPAVHQFEKGAFAGRAARRVVTPGKKAGQIAVIEEADAEFGFEQNAAVFIEMKRPQQARLTKTRCGPFRTNQQPESSQPYWRLMKAIRPPCVMRSPCSRHSPRRSSDSQP